MKLKTRLGLILLIFGMLPLAIMLWVGSQKGLGGVPAFYNTMALSLMGALLAGLLLPGPVIQFFFNRHLQKIGEFCVDVKKGRYDVRLAVPNSDNDNSEDEDELTSLMRNMNWMVHCIKINDAGLRQALSDLEKSQAEIELQKRGLSEALGKLRNLMDNAGQGFLSFGVDLKVTGEYSAECIMIFNQEIANESIQALLYPDDVQQQVFLKTLFERIFIETDQFLRENFFSLLPEELVLDGSYIHITYKLLNNPLEPARKEIMLILTDITEKKAMEKRIQEEKNILSMVVQTVTHYQEFIKAVREYRLFAEEELPAILQAELAAEDKLNLVFRSVHTWKGIFGQLGLERLAVNLHNLESELAKVREGEGQVSMAALQECFAVCAPQALVEWLEAELTLLAGILGDNFFSQEETVVVESVRLRQLEEKVQKLLAPFQARQLIAELRRLRYKPLKELLSMYPDYIVNMAVNQGKELQPFAITGAECLVDPAQYGSFAKSLIHVFRNAVAHGLEMPDERLAADKEASGRIGCVIEEHDGHIVIEITDDGRGIDNEAIREAAMARGVCSVQVAELLPDEAVRKLIFADGFSSAASSNELSGRGVGLAAVQAEVEKLHGYIEVGSQSGQGTVFRFILPRIKEAPPFDIHRFGRQVLTQANSYLQQEFGLEPGRIEEMDSNRSVIPMRNISTFIDVRGNFNGRLMLSADELLVSRLAGHYLGDDEGTGYEKAVLESVFAEFFNTITGNALQEVPQWQAEVNIGAPVTIWAEGASAKYGDANISTWNVDLGIGQMYFSLISFESGEDLDGKGINC